jgi:hypothetical protein
MIEALQFSETSVLTRATRCNVPEDGIFKYNPIFFQKLERKKESDILCGKIGEQFIGKKPSIQALCILYLMRQKAIEAI